MRTNEERLRFAIKFSHANLKKVRKGDLLNFREDLEAFARHFEPFIIPKEEKWILGPGPGKISTDNLVSLQSEMRTALWGVVPGSAIDGFNLTITFKTVNRTDPWKHKRVPGIAVFGTTRDIVMYELFTLLRDSEESNRIRLCPGCRNIFYKVKRQKYCSQRCANRYYMQQYRKAKGEKISELNHKQYVKRMRAKTGRSVRVARRSRRRS